MKILMSAFSCGPGLGSDPGIGWNMAKETARLGHEVVVLTQTEFQAEIERECAAGALPRNLRFDIFMPTWLERLRDVGPGLGLTSVTWFVVSILWQFCALAHVRRHYKSAEFDLVHHVSLSGVRHPTLLTRLGRPTFIGPLGGGERAPMQLRKSYSWKDWFVELLRDIHTWSLRADPMTRAAFRDSSLIFLRTSESLRAVAPRHRAKVHLNVGLGTTGGSVATIGCRAADESLRLIYAGRLLCWKGVHLAIRALAHARQQGAAATLTIVGDGPARRKLVTLAERLGAAPAIRWFGHVPRDQLLGMYSEHHAFLFPSLHDAGGMVVLEAGMHGLPVICLSLGGPGEMVDETSGCVVSTTGRSEEECVIALGSEIVELANNECRRQQLAKGALARSRAYSWPRVAASIYAEIEQCLARDTAAGSRALVSLQVAREVRPCAD